MATEIEFVNYKEFVENLSSVESSKDFDKTVICNEIDGPRSKEEKNKRKELLDSVSSFIFSKNELSSKTVDVLFDFGGVDGSTGEFVVATGRRRTDFIFVNSISAIKRKSDFSGKMYVYCYDGAKNYIGVLNGGDEFYISSADVDMATLLQNAYFGTAYIIIVALNNSYSGWSSWNELQLSVVDEIIAENSVHDVINKESASRAFFTIGRKNLVTVKRLFKTVQGTVDITDGSLQPSTSRYRTDYLDIRNYDGFTATDGNVWVRCYDENKAWLGSARSGVYVSSGNSYQFEDIEFINCRYVILVGTGSKIHGDEYCGVKSNITFSTNPDADNPNSNAYKSGVIDLSFGVGEGYYTTGKLMLPPNYSQYGKPSSLIVFCPGSADMSTLNSPITQYYMDQYEYLCNEGFALLSVYGWGNKYNLNVGTTNCKINRRCWYNGIEYVLRRYNLSRENIFVACKSKGGVQALALLLDGIVPVKAAGLLSPSLNMLGDRFGYGVLNRQAYAAEQGFSADTGNALANGAPIADFIAYAEANYDKWVGYEPYLMGLMGCGKTEKIDKLARNDTDYFTASGIQRVGNRGGLKIWAAEEEGNLLSYCQGLVESLQNTGFNAEMRVMPSGGVDPHHMVDTDPNAPQKENFDTRLGIHVESIALAYWELAQWFIGHECAPVNENY